MDDLATQRARVVMLLDADNAEGALALVETLIDGAPDDPGLRCLQSQALLALDRLPEALEAANRGAALGPSNDWPHRLASMILSEAGDLDGSARAAREAVRLSPNSAEAQENLCFALGRLLVRLGNSGDRADLRQLRDVADEALLAADRVVAVGPTQSSAFEARGYVLGCVRRPQESAAAYERAKQLEVPPPDLD